MRSGVLGFRTVYSTTFNAKYSTKKKELCSLSFIYDQHKGIIDVSELCVLCW